MTYIDPALNLPERVVTYLNSLDVPLRFLRGNAYTFEPPASWRGMARAAGGTIEHCQSEGVTLVSYGTDRIRANGFGALEYRAEIPSDLFEDRLPRYVGRDWLIPANGEPETSIHTGPNQWSFGRVLDRIVYFHLPMDGDSFPWESADLERILGDPIRRARTQSEEREQREQRRQQELAAAALEAFLVASRERFSRRIPELERMVRDNRDLVVQTQSTLERYRTALYEAGQELEALRAAQNAPNEAEERLREQFARLAEHPKIERIESDRNHLIVYTTGLNLTDTRNGESAYLGKFQIKVPIRPGDGVYLNNLDNRQSGWDHPHVQSGAACFGNSDTLVWEFQQNREYVGLIEFLFMYLETFNPEDSYGAHAEYWLASYRHGDEPQEDEEYYDDDEPREWCDCAECRRARQ